MKSMSDPDDLDFASGVDSAIKGIDLLYRRDLSQSIKPEDRYSGHDIYRDKDGNPHLVRKGEDPNAEVGVDLGEGSASMAQASLLMNLPLHRAGWNRSR